MAVGGLAVVVAAVLAFLDEVLWRAALAAELVLLVIGAYLLLSRKIERVRGSMAPLKASGREALKEIKQTKAEIAKVRQSITKLQAAQDNKIALAVHRIQERFNAQLNHEAAGIKSVIKDAEIESGLAALNRYTALAEDQGDPEGFMSEE